MSILNKLIRVAKRTIAASDWHKTALDLAHQYAEQEIKLTSNTICFLLLDKLTLSAQEAHWFLLGYEHLRRLKKNCAAQFTYNNADDSVRVSLSSFGQQVEVIAQTQEDLFILNEIFVEGCYHFKLPNQQIAVVDIGMNVGMASLFFASYPQVERVYGFEPFEPTYLQAQSNIQLNANLDAKIKRFNYGLFSKEETQVFEYSYEHKGRVGIHGTKLVLEKMDNKKKIEVKLEDIRLELPKLIDLHPDAAWVMKIDCEGSEYALFEALASTGGFPKQVRAILMEWHEKGPEILEKQLTAEGFSLLSLYPNTKKVGMLYAFR